MIISSVCSCLMRNHVNVKLLVIWFFDFCYKTFMPMEKWLKWIKIELKPLKKKTLETRMMCCFAILRFWRKKQIENSCEDYKDKAVIWPWSILIVSRWENAINFKWILLSIYFGMNKLNERLKICISLSFSHHWSNHLIIYLLIIIKKKKVWRNGRTKARWCISWSNYQLPITQYIRAK